MSCFFFQTLNISCVFISFATYFVKNLQTQVVSDPKKIKAKRKNQTTRQTSEVIHFYFMTYYLILILDLRFKKYKRVKNTQLFMWMKIKLIAFSITYKYFYFIL